LEQLIVDGPDNYLQTLCDFIGIRMSDADVDHYAKPRNVRVSQLRSLADELLTDDRFFTIYSTLEEEFGRERIQELLDRGDRAIAVLDHEDLADLRSRVASGNRLLAEKYMLDLERYGYAMAASLAPSQKTAGLKTVSRASGLRSSLNDQLLKIIDTERQAKASQMAEMQQLFAAERETAIARIRELEATLKAEHDAFVARIRELEENLEGERHARANQIAEMQRSFAAEREAATARSAKLEQGLARSVPKSVARIFAGFAKRARWDR